MTPAIGGRWGVGGETPTGRGRRRGPALAVAAVLLLAVALPGCVPEGAGDDLELTWENIHHADRGVSEVAVSPDGRYAAVRVDGTERPGLHRVELEGAGHGEIAFWVEGRQPAWSPDGEAIAYVRDGALWLSRPDDAGAVGGERSGGAEEDGRSAATAERRVAGPMEGLRAPAWSPDGSRIAFYSRETGHQDIWLVEVEPDGGETSEPRRLTPGAMPEDDPRFAPAWSPDGRRIAYVSNRADYWADDIWLVDVESGHTRRISDTFMASSTPVWSPDGDRIAVFGTAKDGYWYQDLSDIYLLDPGSGTEEVVEMQVWASDRAMRNRPLWSGDGERIYFPYMERGDYGLWAVPAGGGVATRMTNVGGDMRSFDATASGDAFFFVRSAPEHGRELYRISAGGGSAERITRLSPTWDRRIVPTEISYRSFDGLYIQGFLYLPPDTQAGEADACPALVEVHGGGTNSYLRGQNLTEQYLASRGFVVLAINYRGGSGFGRAFQDLAVEDWLNRQALDAGAAADYLKAMPHTTDRVGIYGGSYGGSMSLAAATRTPEKFDAAVPMRGAYSKTTTFELIDRLGQIFTKTGHGGLPEERADTYEKSNTVARLDALEAPVLLMHGELDRRVPFRSHELAVAALDSLGKEYEERTYPDEGHGFRDPANRIDMYTRLEEFMRRHLGECR